MKKISYLLFILMIGFTIIACRDTLSDKYAGEPQLHFSQGTASNQIILGGTNFKDVQIPFGTISNVSGDQKVSLIFDKEKSTAIEGVDFKIIENPVTLSSGNMSGMFTVRLFEQAASATPKTAVFTLSSPTIKNAIFDQTYTLGISKFCSISSFVGTFSYSGFFDSYDVEIVEHTSLPKTLLIKDFAETGYDIKLTYDESGKVDFVPQQTGYIHQTYGMITINPAKGKQSTFNSCTRQLTLYANYTVSAGSFGDSVEEFQGK